MHNNATPIDDDNAETSISAHANCRIDLTGGYTDVSPFCVGTTGYAVNLAIEPAIDFKLLHRRVEPDVLIINGEVALDQPEAPLSHRLGRQLARHFEVRGRVELEITADLPSASGLGTSGALGVGMAKAFGQLVNDPMAPIALAKMVAAAERMAGSPGGIQDQLAAAFAGCGLVACEGDWVGYQRIELSPQFASLLQRSFTLVHIPAPRSSGDLVRDIMGRWSEGHAQIRRAFDRLNSLGPTIAQSLERADYERLFESMAEVGALQGAGGLDVLSGPNAALAEALRAAGPIAVKATGGGGLGSCVLALQPMEGHVAVERIASQFGGRVVPFQIYGTDARQNLSQPNSHLRSGRVVERAADDHGHSQYLTTGR
jgi:galactokinase/mevalonate kinase-like predicted kinase